MAKIIRKVCPPASELSIIRNRISCTEAGCDKTFMSSANLDLHLLKNHKIVSQHFQKKFKEEAIIQYHCPETICSYNINSDRFFKQMKYLKQHYLKVHAEKSFKCEQCSKGFPTHSAMKRHTLICGMKFVCSCSQSYDSYEALLTHARRTNHTFDSKYKNSGKMSQVTAPCTEFVSVHASNLTHQSVSTVAVPVFLAAVALSELSNACWSKTLDMAVQTDPTVLGKRPQRANILKSSEKRVKQGTSQQTQTGSTPRNIQPKTSTQTQTSGDYILKKAMRAARIPITQEKQVPVPIQMGTKKRRKSMETQTIIAGKRNKKMELGVKYADIVDKTNNFQSLDEFTTASSYQLNMDNSLPDLWIGQKNSSATQTSPLKNSIDQEMLNSVTQTDINLSAFFESESCEPSTSYMHSSSQTVKLSSCFEDSSNGCFGTDGTNNNYQLRNESCNGFSSFDEPGYSCSQMDNMLTQHKKYDFDEHRSCSIETQTELDSLLTECTDDDTSFTLSSNIETQTTEDISVFDPLIYTNMCTQTCDDFLFSDLGFVDIQTQTAFSEYGDDSVFVSTETQTALSGSSATSNWVGSEMSHMETQTDEFRELIAELEKQNTSDKVL